MPLYSLRRVEKEKCLEDQRSNEASTHWGHVVSPHTCLAERQTFPDPCWPDPLWTASCETDFPRLWQPSAWPSVWKYTPYSLLLLSRQPHVRPTLLIYGSLQLGNLWTHSVYPPLCWTTSFETDSLHLQ